MVTPIVTAAPGITAHAHDPAVGTGSALVEFYFKMADFAAEVGDDDSADFFWQLATRTANA